MATGAFSGSISEILLDGNNNSASSKAKSTRSKNYEKYSLRPRSIQVRIETEKRQKEEVKKKPKPKQKPPPLSKYRRKTANARERSRMKEINSAFETLQRAVPQYPILPVNSSGKTCEKLTKITTLRLAMNYIEALTTLLNPPVVPTNNNDSIMDDFSSSAGSDCSPASSYTMSPLSSPPECLQTVMRSVVSPSSSFASSPNSVCSSSSSPSSSSCSASSSPSSTSAVSNSCMSSSPASSSTVITPKIINNHPSNNSHHHHQPHHHHHHLLLQHQMSLANGLVMSPANSVASFVAECLPPPMTISSIPSSSGPLPSIATITRHRISGTTAASIATTTTNICGNNNNNNNANNNRAGSLSSLTESEFSEYTSDLLSDEGSTLDDPMFEDLIGVGTVATDFPDILLDSDGDSLHFSSDLSDN